MAESDETANQINFVWNPEGSKAVISDEGKTAQGNLNYADSNQSVGWHSVQTTQPIKVGQSFTVRCMSSGFCYIGVAPATIQMVSSYIGCKPGQGIGMNSQGMIYKDGGPVYFDFEQELLELGEEFGKEDLVTVIVQENAISFSVNNGEETIIENFDTNGVLYPTVSLELVGKVTIQNGE
eukprot:TRINITY_DN1631_c0_g1_i1.p1 TRINITY_DN1631_c0_g1~~TRINITY_DN1631_c0_g1_i1.p1  ORF type:complete len:180 (-),score=31.82 TRINITY_DN1631_c0_g1_i1:23-562(-)